VLQPLFTHSPWVCAINCVTPMCVWLNSFLLWSTVHFYQQSSKEKLCQSMSLCLRQLNSFCKMWLRSATSQTISSEEAVTISMLSSANGTTGVRSSRCLTRLLSNLSTLNHLKRRKWCDHVVERLVGRGLSEGVPHISLSYFILLVHHQLMLVFRSLISLKRKFYRWMLCFKTEQ